MNQQSQSYSATLSNARRKSVQKSTYRQTSRRQTHASDASAQNTFAQNTLSQTKLSRNLEQARRECARERAAERAAVKTATKTTRMYERTYGTADGALATARSPHKHHSYLRVISVCLIVIAVVVAGCAFLYEPARQYYVEIRDRDRVQAEYDAVQERNDALQSQIDALYTDTGVADAARSELGWVMEGETAGLVSGLDEDSSGVSGSIPLGSVEAPETWYSVIFDPIFGIE